MTEIVSLVSNAFSLLINLAIFTSAAMDDSMDRISPLQAIEFEFLDFSGVGSHWMIFLLSLQTIPSLVFIFLQESSLTHGF